MKNKKKTTNWRLFSLALLLFLIIQSFSLFSAMVLYNQIQATDVFATFSYSQLLPDILIGLIVGIFLLALLYSLRKKKYVLKGFFSFFIFIGSIYIIQIYFPFFLSIFLSLGLVILWLKVKKIWVHDLCIGLVIGGLGINFGQIIPLEIILIGFGVLCIYDLIAVLKTKFLVKIFTGFAREGMVLGLIIPADLADFNKEHEKVSLSHKIFYLGTGDLLLPIMLAVAVLPSSLLSAVLVMFGAVFGLAVLYLLIYFLKIQRPLPALPPIALFSIIGFIISLFI